MRPLRAEEDGRGLVFILKECRELRGGQQDIQRTQISRKTVQTAQFCRGRHPGYVITWRQCRLCHLLAELCTVSRASLTNDFEFQAIAPTCCMFPYYKYI